MTFETPVPGIPGAIFRRVGALRSELPNSTPAGPHMWAKPGELLIAIPDVGHFLAREGKIVEFAPSADADDGTVQLILNGSARGALIHQRGELPLHAATLVPPRGDSAVAICGPSGAGKSTLAAELSRRGWILVADDTTRVTWNGKHPLAWPSRDTIKLWRDACEAGGFDIAALERATATLDKYYVQVPARDEPIRLGAIIELAPAETARVDTKSASERMSLVSRNTYRSSHIKPLGRQVDHIRIVSHVVGHCRIVRFDGALTRTVRELADAAEKVLVQ